MAVVRRKVGSVKVCCLILFLMTVECMLLNFNVAWIVYTGLSFMKIVKLAKSILVLSTKLKVITCDFLVTCNVVDRS